MASTKEMMARARARKKAERQMAVITSSPEGTSTKTYDNLDDYYAERNKELEQATAVLISQMNDSTNVDLSLFAKPTLRSKTYKLAGKAFQADIHCDNKASEIIAKHSGKDVGSVIQLWNNSQSLILLFTNESLNDARKNWNGDLRIKAEDRLSQTVAAFRLIAPDMASHNIAMFLAYEHKEVDAAGCHAVWD